MPRARMGSTSPQMVPAFTLPEATKDNPRRGHISGFATGAHRIFLLAENENTYVNARLGPTPPATVSGYGGWEEQPIPGERAEPVWRGVGVIGVAVEIILGSLRQPRTDIAPQIDALERLAGLEDGFETRKPPAIIVHGRTIPHNFHENPNWRWVIAEFAWGDIADGKHGRWHRRSATFTLWRLGKGDALEKLRPRKTHPDTRTVRARKDDTYNKIAQRELGTYRLGPRLARFNDARDPRKKLDKGKVVRLPSKHKAQQWREDLRSIQGRVEEATQIIGSTTRR